jgi:hypothetical protein
MRYAIPFKITAGARREALVWLVRDSITNPDIIILHISRKLKKIKDMNIVQEK